MGERAEELLRPQSLEPSPPHYVVIEAVIGFRQVAATLGVIPTHEPIEHASHSDFTLGRVRESDQQLLRTPAHQLDRGATNLSPLHAILTNRAVYEQLLAQGLGLMPNAIAMSASALRT